MANLLGDEDYERLRRKVDGYGELLCELQGKEHFFRRFQSWGEVITFMRGGTSNDPEKDNVLRPIFRARRANRDPRWQEILLTIFWPGLVSIYMKKSKWDNNEDERWANVLWAFLQAIHRLNVKRRPNRLVQKIYNSTVHYLYGEYQRETNLTTKEQPVDADKMDYRVGVSEEYFFMLLDIRETIEAQIQELQRHLSRGRISKQDYALIVGTRVYGESLVNYARKTGLEYEAAKKSRLRAEAAIARAKANTPFVTEGSSKPKKDVPKDGLNTPFV